MSTGSTGGEAWAASPFTAVVWLLVRAWPWLLACVAAAVVAAGVVRVVRARRHHRLLDGARQVRITPPPQVDAAGVVAWWATVRELLITSWWRRLRYGAPHVAMEYRWAGRALTVVVWLPGGVPAEPVVGAALAAWPGCATAVAEADSPRPARRWSPPVVRSPRSCRPGTRCSSSTAPTRCGL
ncbi:hypothetical protein [Dactylosporangium cerinum]